MNNRGVVDMMKWFAYQVGFIALAWFGYQEGIPWCENIFMFFTWGKLILSIVVTVLPFILKNAMDDGSFGATKTIKFYNDTKDKLQMPVIIPIIVNTMFMVYLAGLGHIVLAYVWFVIAVANAICLSIVKELTVTARNFAERHRARNATHTGREAFNADADGVFTNDDNDLFRIGITETVPEDE